MAWKDSVNPQANRLSRSEPVMCRRRGGPHLTQGAPRVKNHGRGGTVQVGRAASSDKEEEMATVTVTVYRDGQPVKGARVVLRVGVLGGVYSPEYTGDEGAGTIEPVSLQPPLF
jgi:hypothetical protein